MNRLSILLLCFILTLCPSGALGAGTVIYGANDASDASITGMLRCVAYADGTTYIFTLDDSGFLAIKDGGDRIKYAWEQGALSNQDEDALKLQTAVAHDDKLYALCLRVRHNYEENTQRIRGAFLYEVTLDHDKRMAGLGDRVKLDWSGMIDEVAGGESSRATIKPFIQDGKLVFTTYGDSGENQVMAYDVLSGDCDIIPIANLTEATAYKGGMALVQTCDLNSSPAKYTFSALDLNTGALSTLAQRDMPDMIHPANILYDEKTDNLYYRMSGELWVARGMEIDQARSVSVAGGYGAFTSQLALTKDGYILVPDYETVVKYNADPNARTQKAIRVIDWSDITERGALVFSGRHPDVEVIKDPNRDGIIEAMMNRSGFVDVYCVETKNSDYRALYNRGFMADLSQSQALNKLVGEMYPAIQKAVIKDGKLVALPVTMFTITFGYYPKAFEAIGLAPEDAPKTWIDFLTALKDLPDVVDDYGNISVFDMGSTASSTKRTILEQVISSWLLHLGSNDSGNVSFDSPIIRDILVAFDQINFDELCKDATHDAYDTVGSAGDVSTDVPLGAMGGGGGQGDMALFTTFSTLSVSAPYSQNDAKPLILALNEELPPLIQSDISLMFVNPFSANLELAKEFVECTAGKLEDAFLTETCPNRNEPIVSTYAQSFIDEMKKEIDAMQQALERADESDRAIIKNNIEIRQADLEQFEKTSKYRASNESIAQYREYAGSIRAVTSIGIDVKNSPEIATVIRQYADGAINAEALIHTIDQTLRMMMLEGM